ncbi:SDR family NAD(P)-dependent oxidoreductase [Alcanivorax sp. DP30]|uniref:SDR family NAD(P)-dependent oxidoreductase n=1 Tax=Alcanivorax sp. DP30 TaxID=2606217 RepID=UPI00136C2A45|nr:SDR family NAD(P)-dependent oxidoreductase [Alcanivorax sp. DP30]MZR61600.1 SDR family NAD(P)-dependent oxidoreductase [Alcanivorax sp. DP30]
MKHAPVLLLNHGDTPLGEAVARLAVEKYRVAITGNDSARGNQLCSQMHAAGREAMFLETREGEGQDHRRNVDRIMRRWQQLDVVINLPRHISVGPFEATSAGQWQQQIHSQLMDTVHLCQSSLTALRHQQTGRILNVIIEYALLPSPLTACQSAMGAAIKALSNSLYAEMHESGISVSAVAIPLLAECADDIDASDPLSATRFRRLANQTAASLDEVSSAIYNAIDCDRSLQIATPEIRTQWRQKRWFRRRWEDALKQLGKRYRPR